MTMFPKDFHLAFFLFIPIAELSNAKASKTLRNPTKVTTHASSQQKRRPNPWVIPDEMDESALQSKSKRLAAFGAVRWVGRWVKHKYPPALPERCVCSLGLQQKANTLGWSSAASSQPPRGRNWHFFLPQLEVAHPVPVFSTEFTRWSKILTTKRKYKPLCFGLLNHDYSCISVIFSWKVALLFWVKISLCQREYNKRLLYNLFFQLCLPPFIKAAGISFPIIMYHLVHISCEVDFQMWGIIYIPLFIPSFSHTVQEVWLQLPT